MMNHRQRNKSIHHPQNKNLIAQQQQFLKQLSLSFYPTHIIKDQKKQVILDSCIFQSSLDINDFTPLKYLKHKHEKLSQLNNKKVVDGSLKIDNYFDQQKVDYIQLITTNASHLQNDISNLKKNNKGSQRKIRAVSMKSKGRKQQIKEELKTQRSTKKQMKRKGKSCISISKKN